MRTSSFEVKFGVQREFETVEEAKIKVNIQTEIE